MAAQGPSTAAGGPGKYEQDPRAGGDEWAWRDGPSADPDPALEPEAFRARMPAIQLCPRGWRSKRG